MIGDDGVVIARKPRSIFSGCLAITLLMSLCIGGTVWALDQRCQQMFNLPRPVYPAAALVAEQGEFFDFYQATYTTADTPATVEAWYEATLAVIRREAAEQTGTSTGLWSGSLEVAADAGGSQIIMTTECRR